MWHGGKGVQDDADSPIGMGIKRKYAWCRKAYMLKKWCQTSSGVTVDTMFGQLEYLKSQATIESQASLDWDVCNFCDTVQYEQQCSMARVRTVRQSRPLPLGSGLWSSR